MREETSVCVRCGQPLTEFRVTHFESGRRTITLEALCTTHACEAYVRPGAQSVGHVGSRLRAPSGAPAHAPGPLVS